MAAPILTPLRRISTAGGDVFHAMKSGDEGFAGFGEAYFTTISAGAVKGWKRHREMTMNLVVPCGRVSFVVHDEAISGEAAFREFELSPDHPGLYARLTVPPGLWMAFRGMGEGLNIVLNLASILHDPAEADNVPIEHFPWLFPR